MGAYQHTKPNGHTIPGMNRVTVQWERVIVYQESCDSTLDQDWNIKDLDVRCMDYYHDPSLRVLINLDNDFYVHSNGIDEDAQGGINPVIVPFEELEKMDNLGIRIK